MKKYTVLKVAVSKPDEHSVNYPNFLNAEGQPVVVINNQHDIDPSSLETNVVIFTDLEKAREFKDRVVEESEKIFPGEFGFSIFEIETVFSSVWKDKEDKMQGKFFGYRILGEEIK